MRTLKILCAHCGRDINALGQDNMSHVVGSPLCEDCYQMGRGRENVWVDCQGNEYECKLPQTSNPGEPFYDIPRTPLPKPLYGTEHWWNA